MISDDQTSRDAAGDELFGRETLSLANGAGGDRAALDELLRRVDRRLRRLARFAARQDQAGQDLGITDLVGRANQRVFLGPSGARTGRWKSPRHFRNAYVQAMGWVLTDHARACLRRDRQANPHPDPRHRPASLDDLTDLNVGKLYRGDPNLTLDIADGLAKLERDHPLWHAVVVGRVYGGQTFGQLGADLGVPERTACNWYACGIAELANLLRALRPPDPPGGDESMNS